MRWKNPECFGCCVESFSVFIREKAFIPQLQIHFLDEIALPVYRYHRRRIHTKEKAKVVAASWETEFIQFLAALAILHQDDLKNMMNPFLHIILA